MMETGGIPVRDMEALMSRGVEVRGLHTLICTLGSLTQRFRFEGGEKGFQNAGERRPVSSGAAPVVWNRVGGVVRRGL